MRTIVCAAAAAVLSACGQTASEPAPVEAPAPAPVTAPELALAPLQTADMQGRLGGELGCSFTADGGQLLVASGIVASQTPSEAVMKLDGVVVEMDATAPGGFDTLEDGETFAGGGVNAAVTTSAAIETGTEEVRHSATLTVTTAGGERAYEGAWTCGP